MLPGAEKGSGAPGVGGGVCVGGKCCRGDVGVWEDRGRGEAAVGIVAGFCYFCVTEPNL